MIQQFISKQFFAFIITGGIAAAINFGSRILYSNFMSFSNAVIVAYVTGMITAFVLAKLFVFTEGTQSIKQSAFIFTLVNIVAVAQTWLVSMALAHYLLPAFNIEQFKYEIAHAAGVLVPVFTSFIGHKYWSFR